ncbi:hypothetical protein ES703_113085 [subsurface metagenome]
MATTNVLQRQTFLIKNHTRSLSRTIPSSYESVPIISGICRQFSISTGLKDGMPDGAAGQPNQQNPILIYMKEVTFFMYGGAMNLNDIPKSQSLYLTLLLHGTEDHGQFSRIQFCLSYF